MMRGALHLLAFDAVNDDVGTQAMALMPLQSDDCRSTLLGIRDPFLRNLRAAFEWRQATNAGIYDYAIGHSIESR